MADLYTHTSRRALAGPHARVARLSEVVESFAPRTFDVAEALRWWR